MSSFRLVNEQVRSNAIAAVKAAGIGGDSVLVVRIEPEKKSRTQRQNRYLWGVVYKTIVDNDPGFFGNDEKVDYLNKRGISMSEVVHEYCKYCFMPATDLYIQEDENDGFNLMMTKSTTKLTRQEFNEYVENIRRWAADSLEIFIPDPTAVGYEDLVWSGNE